METALNGVRVLDLTLFWSGPYCTMMLADLGAEVIRVEAPPEKPTPVTSFTFKGLDAPYIGLSRNKKGITLNLKSKKGRDIFYELVKKADVVVDNFRVGVCERLGVDYDSLAKINPRIITCSITGFGPTGPYSNRPAFEPVAAGISGIISMLSYPDPPREYNISVVDVPAGMFAAHGIMAALYAREKTGKGQKVETSLLESVVAMLTPFVTSFFVAGKTPLAQEIFATKDGYIVTEPRMHFQIFCLAAGREDLAQDPRYATSQLVREQKNIVDPLISEMFLTKTTKEWLEILIKAGIPCGPINTLAQGLSDPQVLHRNMIIELEHESGDKTKATGNPIKMSATPKDLSRKYTFPPKPGQHNEQILGNLLGYSKEKIEELRREKII